MKAKINKKTKEAARKYIKYLAYFMYFYFGWRLIVVPIIFTSGAGELTTLLGSFGFIFNLILGLGFVVSGIICAYNLSRFKRWAFIALIILIALHAASIVINSLALGKIKLPAIQIAIVLTLIWGFKHLKNAQ